MRLLVMVAATAATLLTCRSIEATGSPATAPPIKPPPAPGLSLEDIFHEPRLEGTRPDGETISPDEKWVAFTWNSEGWNAPLDLYVVPSGGGKPRALTAFPRDATADSLRLERRKARELKAAPPDTAVAKLPEHFKEASHEHRVESIVWAPDSRRIAFVDRGELYVVEVDGSHFGRLTFTRAAESEPNWSPDGRSIAFLRDGAVWILQLQRAGELQLTETGIDSLVPSGIQWSPDGSHIAYSTRNETGLRALLVPDYLSERVRTRSVKEGLPDLGVRIVSDPSFLEASPAGGKRAAGGASPYTDLERRPVAVRLGPGKHPAIDAVAWSPDSRSLAIDEVLSDMRTRRLHVARADSGTVRTVYAETDSAWIEPYDWVIADRPVLDWSPDSRWILFATERTGYSHLARVPADGGAVEQLTDGAWEVAWARWLADGSHIVLMGNRAAPSQRHLEILNVAARQLEPLQTAPGMNTHPWLGHRGGTVVYQHSRFAEPQELFTIAVRPGAKPVQVTASVPERFRQVPWCVPQLVDFPARDGTALHGLLYRPEKLAPGKRYPVVVFVHGAGSLQNVVDGWTIYSPNFEFHTRLVQQGYLVFEVDYRGSLGYGHAFRTGVHRHLGGKDLDDELAGVDYLAGLDFVDASRLGIYGGSYGGFLPLMALFRDPDVFACGAALRFVADWANYYRGNPWYCIQRLGTPDKNATAYYRSSPIHFAEGLRRPLLLLHGMRDDNVHFQDAAQLTERLIRLGKKFELMIYPHESHGFVSTESWIDEYGRIESFFDQHLTPGLEPAASGSTSAGARR